MTKRASDEEVIFNILSILRDNGEVTGEFNFLEMLRRRNSSLSPNRFRKLIFRIPEILVTVRYARVKLGKLEKCPICGSKMRPVRLLNLEGRRVIVGYKCPRCHYNSSKNGKPYIYEFRLKSRDIRH
ncbi:MAG: hypothetical protein QW100_01135 [Thermoplasmatales archaeon]